MNVFITGASSGIGAASGERVREARGACLGLVARRRDALGPRVASQLCRANITPTSSTSPTRTR